jgi:hypothetical protein
VTAVGNKHKFQQLSVPRPRPQTDGYYTDKELRLLLAYSIFFCITENLTVRPNRTIAYQNKRHHSLALKLHYLCSR